MWQALVTVLMHASADVLSQHMSNLTMSTPIRLDTADDEGTRLTRIPHGIPPFDEDGLQSLLEAHPHALPVPADMPKHAPLIPLGREVSSSAGSIDLLYISPNGHLTVVETKLWKNPEARRRVVAQILDYAAALATWGYEELNAAVTRARDDGAGIWSCVAPKTDISEAQFIDAVNRQMQQGAFLLLIVGDGIRERAETLTKYVQRVPHLHFSLHLITLSLYRLHPDRDWPLLVYPETVARTTEIERAVVTVQTPDGAQPPVVHTEAPEPPSASARRPTLTPDAFHEHVAASTSPKTMRHVRELIEQLEGRGAEPAWGSSAVSMRLPDPHSSEKFTLVDKSGMFSLSWLNKIEDKDYPAKIWRTYRDAVVRLTGANITGSGAATSIHPVSEIAAPEKRGRFLEIVDAYIERLRSHTHDT